MARLKTYEFPVKYFEGNLMFGMDGSCWGVFEMTCEEYDMLSYEGKLEFIARLERFISNVGKEAKIFVIPIKQSLEESYEYEMRELERGYRDKNDPIYRYGKNYINNLTDNLERNIIKNGGTNDYKVFVLTKFEPPKKRRSIGDMIMNPTGNAEQQMGISRNLYINKRDLEAYKRESSRYVKLQSARFRIREVSSDTIQWLIGRIFLRGTPKEPYIRKSGGENPWTPRTEEYKVDFETYIKPDTYSIMNFFNYRIEFPKKRGERYLMVSDEFGNTTYQSFLAMSHMPETLNMPSSEWIKPLLDLPFGVETCISIKSTEHRKADKKLHENKKKIEGQDLHARRSGEVSGDDIRKAYADSDRLADDLAVYNDPLIEMSVTIALASESKEDLYDQVKSVEREFENLQFRVQQPASDVLRCFYEMIPASPVQYNSYVQITAPSAVATSVFPVAVESGDGTGHFIGQAGERGKYIFLALAEAIRHNRSSGTAILGTLGGGKSVLANFLGYQTALLDGGRALFIDPKSERGILWKEYLKEFDGEIGITTIDYNDKGVFDPFVIYRPESEEWFNRHLADYEHIPNNSIHTYADYRNSCKAKARSLALAMFTEELDLGVPANKKSQLAFGRAIKYASRFRQPSMNLVIRLLEGSVKGHSIFEEDDKLRDAAELLADEMRQLRENNALAGLIMGNGDERGLSFGKKINIMQIQGLDFPSENMPVERYTPQQKTSATIMIPLGEFAKEFIRDPLLYSIPKAVVFDESWFLKSTAQGALLYSEIARTGRSFFAIPIFIGHSVGDVNEDGIRESLTYMFIFRMQTKTEAVAALKLLQLEETDENIGLVTNLRNGECLFRDLDGRVQRLNVVIPYQNLLNAFETNPEKRDRLFREVNEKKKGRL